MLRFSPSQCQKQRQHPVLVLMALGLVLTVALPGVTEDKPMPTDEKGSDVIHLETTQNGLPKGIELSTPLTIIDDSAIKAGITAEGLAPEDERNLEALWLGILQHNPTIQYALRQLNMPEDVRRHHKSLMARTMSGLLSGVGMLPYAFGNSAASIGAASITQSLANRLAAKADKIDPKTLPTDAELVALSSTVEGVRSDLVSSYYAYKQALQGLTDLDSQRQTIEGFREKARKTADWQDDALAEMQVQAIERDRLEARQQAERSYLRLERLVGAELMTELSFLPQLPSSANSVTDESQGSLTVETPDTIELKPGETP
jgi:hypothetical protein